MRTLWRYVLLAVGTVSLVAGVIGVFVPILPTTPFLLLAAACYIRSSEQLYHWLLDHRHLGRYVSDFVSGAGVPFRAKVIALSLMWVTTTMTSVFFITRFGVSVWTVGHAVGLACIAAGVHYYIGFHLPTRTPDAKGRERGDG